MALSEVTTTFNLSDYIGGNYDPRRTKVYLTTNAEKNRISDTSTGEIRLGGGTVTLGADGAVSATTWAPGVDANPASWQTTFNIDYVDSATRQRQTVAIGPFTITTSGLLTALDVEQTVPAEYLTTVTQQLDTKVTAAEVARAGAEAAEAAAVGLVTSDLGTTDGQTRALIDDPNSQTSAALSASTVQTAAQAAHAPGLGLFFPEAEGATGDGVADDAAAVQAAYAAAVANTGGGQVYLTQRYRLASTIALSDGTKGVRLIGSGGELRPDAGVIAVRLASGVMTDSRPSILVGVRVDGQALGGNVGVQIRDHFNATLRDCHFYNLAVGVQITDQTKWSESSVLDNLYISNCGIGVELVTAGGTGSFGYCAWTHVNIDNIPEGGVGFKVGAGTFFVHSTIELLNLHGSAGSFTGFQVDGDAGRNSEIRMLFEGGSGGTAVARVGVSIGPNGVLDGCRLATFYAGTLNTRISNPSSKPFQVYIDRDRQRASRATGENVVEYFVHGEANPRMAIRPGRIIFGDGTSSTLDVGITRSEADTLALDGGDSLKVDGTWNGGKVRHGNWRQWVDANQIMRVKSSNPSSDTDGNIVVSGLLEANTPNLDNVGAGINTAGKYRGKCVFNTNTLKPVWATGGAAADTWVDATGVVAHTPV